MSDKPKIITVEAGPKTKDGQVALWERDPAHPDGEVFVVGGRGPVEVAETGLVRERVAKDLLQRVERRAASATAEGAGGGAKKE